MSLVGPDDHIPEHVAREAVRRAAGKQVDLVIYKGGERIVVGKASVQEDGKIEAQIAKDVRKDVMEIIKGRLGDISLNPHRPAPQKVAYDKTTYVASSTPISKEKI